MAVYNKSAIRVYGGNGLEFMQDTDERPRLQDFDDSIQIYTGNGILNIDKDKIDDVVRLLMEAKKLDYKIDFNDVHDIENDDYDDVDHGDPDLYKHASNLDDKGDDIRYI